MWLYNFSQVDPKPCRSGGMFERFKQISQPINSLLGKDTIMEPVELQQGATAALIIFQVIGLALFGTFIASFWKLFSKAGVPAWHSIVPILNVVQLARIAGKSGWFALLLMIPVVSIVAGAILYMSLAKSFGKTGGFGIGLLLLPIPFLPMLAFGDAKYVGTQGVQVNNGQGVMNGSPNLSVAGQGQVQGQQNPQENRKAA